MKQMTNNVLTPQEYNTLLVNLGGLLTQYYTLMDTNVTQRDELNRHLTELASKSILDITNPEDIYKNSLQILNSPALLRLYAQIEFQLFSIGINGYNDSYDRLCRSIAKAIPNIRQSRFSIWKDSNNGGIYDLAIEVRKPRLKDLLRQTTREDVICDFLLNHRHLVLQILIMQFYCTVGAVARTSTIN